MHALALTLLFLFQAPETKGAPRYTAELQAVYDQADVALKAMSGDFTEAQRNVQRLVDEAPENPRTHFLVGRMLIPQSQYEEALRAMERALELGLDGVDRIEAVQWRDSLRRQVAALAEVRDALAERLQKNPDDVEAHAERALLTYLAHDLEGARTHAVRVTELRPDDKDGHALLGLILLSSGNEDGAREQARLARSLGDSERVRDLELRLQRVSQRRLFFLVPRGLVLVLVLGLGGYWLMRRRARVATPV
ncbi:tetratricopeptide repeat protein [Myxococcus sp. K15C18031901]|uniref:tetratricopeptide repeat protein n=1 Tax=Myxococcus dinghuensis TaxID=2906761 RepID=UPI0020A76DEC|nr:tetratricopeptide repeat protein [Myxococcus dinghuensis]MCP3100919.1 tetratricopeptide repeat protein [Myxococcus dinghuensis]